MTLLPLLFTRIFKAFFQGNSFYTISFHSKSISNIEELAQYLSYDLKNIKKDQNNYVSIINNLGNKTLDGVMKSINKFLIDESIKT